MNIKNSKEIILNQALTIFGRLGFHKTTMADIANASKRGRRTIYMYFKNKEEVYEAVVEREIDRIVEKLSDELKNTSKIEDKFKIFINSRIRAIIKLTRDYDALKIAFVNNNKWVNKIRKKLDTQEKLILSSLLLEAKNTKQFAIDDIAITVKNITMIVKGIEYMLIKEDNEDLTAKHVQNLQDLLLNGLLRR